MFRSITIWTLSKLFSLDWPLAPELYRFSTKVATVDLGPPNWIRRSAWQISRLRRGYGNWRGIWRRCAQMYYGIDSISLIRF